MAVETRHNNNYILRGTTPTPTIRVVERKEPSDDRKSAPSDSSVAVFYDTALSLNPPAVEEDLFGDLDRPGSSSMYGDAQEGKPDFSMSDQARSNRRRSPRSSSASHHRSQITRPPPASSTPYGFTIPENVHNLPTSSGFPASNPHYPVASMPYDQRTGFRPYPMSTQPPLNMDHTPPPPFPYSHPYSQHGVPDSNMMPQNIHASYRPMLQPHTSVYQYQRHSPDAASPAHPFSPAGPSSMYQRHTTATPPIHSPPPTSSTGPSTPYVGTNAYHSLHYPSQTPQYAYPHPQAFSTPPPMYPPQYAPTPYSQHFPGSPPEAERQGTWWYLPHTGPVSPQQYENVPSQYQSHYPMPYSATYPDMDNPYAAGSPTSPRSSSAYPMSPPPQPTSPPHPVPTPTSPPIPAPATSQRDTGGPAPPVEKPIVRRSYHPNPPAHRSEWVMWAGNVPSDATHDELWRFFNQLPPDSAGDDPASTGVLSIFLISRSSCAFVNFESEQHLMQAIARFNNQALRPNDYRCPRLVCRVRKKDDDLKAGVGGQRGIGIHTKWVQDQKGKRVESSDVSDASTEDRPSTESPDKLARVLSQTSLSSNEESRQMQTTKHSSSSGSFTSTNSSLLTRYFPKRYFILKSLTQFDLDLSVEKGLWATQKHNEGILDQAYRTSQEVFLIFSVNKSGEFYGYAKMAGPIRHGEHRVSWATRTTDSSTSSRSSLSPVTGRVSGQSSSIQEEGSPTSGRVSQLKSQSKNFFSQGPGLTHLVESPRPLVGSDTKGNESAQSSSSLLAVDPESPVVVPESPIVVPGAAIQSAPAELGAPRQKAIPPPMVKHSLDTQIFQGRAPKHISDAMDEDDFELDPEAPIRAMRSSGSGESPEQSPGTGNASSRGMSLLQAVAEEEEKGEDDQKEEGPVAGTEAAAQAARDESWGESFKIEWLCTEKLPFHRTRHIRNPWNHDREVKVSRDGTELEPTVGKRLLEEWSKLSEAQSPTVQPGKLSSQAKRAGKAGTAKESGAGPSGVGG